MFKAIKVQKMNRGITFYFITICIFCVTQCQAPIVIQPQQPQKMNLSVSYFEKGNEYLNNGDNENAKIYYLKVLEEDRIFAPAMIKLGIIAFEKNDYEAARKYINSAIDIDPKNQEFRDLYKKFANKVPIKWDAPPPPPEGPKVMFIPYDDPPIPLSPIRPRYPEVAQEASIEGTVIVKVFVDENGIVTETAIMKGIPNTGLDEAAIKAIRSVKWKPAQQRDRAIGVWISVPINFNLNK